MSTGTYSTTYTYTVTDVGKVFDQIRADFHMAAQSTGLWTDKFVDSLMDDVKRYAQHGYLRLVAIYLENSAGVALRAATYEVSDSAGGWKAERPGNMLWPRGANLRLRTTIDMSGKWWSLDASHREAFSRGLRLEWPTTNSQNLGFPHLLSTNDRNYVSNGYGVQKKLFR